MLILQHDDMYYIRVFLKQSNGGSGPVGGFLISPVHGSIDGYPDQQWPGDEFIGGDSAILTAICEAIQGVTLSTGYIVRDDTPDAPNVTHVYQTSDPSHVIK
jgi:hypothetical protein